MSINRMDKNVTIHLYSLCVLMRVMFIGPSFPLAIHKLRLLTALHLFSVVSLSLSLSLPPLTVEEWVTVGLSLLLSSDVYHA